MHAAIQINTVCNYQCAHCMFSCNSNGKWMSPETAQFTTRLLKDSRIDELSIYGGEPFLNIEKFNYYQLMFFPLVDRIFISSNGTFLLNNKKTEYVFDIINNRKYSDYERSIQVRISASDFHKDFWSNKMKFEIQQFKYYLQEPYCFWEYAEEKGLKEYYDNPIEAVNGEESPIYIDDFLKGRDWPNPSGRALKNGFYKMNKTPVACMASSSYHDSDRYDFESDFTFAIDANGDIGLCCYSACGNIGNVRDYYSLDGVMENAIKFNEQFREAYDIDNETRMVDKCALCRKFKYDYRQPIKQSYKIFEEEAV